MDSKITLQNNALLLMQKLRAAPAGIKISDNERRYLRQNICALTNAEKKALDPPFEPKEVLQQCLQFQPPPNCPHIGTCIATNLTPRLAVIIQKNENIPLPINTTPLGDSLQALMAKLFSVRYPGQLLDDLINKIRRVEIVEFPGLLNTDPLAATRIAALAATDIPRLEYVLNQTENRPAYNKILLSSLKGIMSTNKLSFSNLFALEPDLMYTLGLRTLGEELLTPDESGVATGYEAGLQPATRNLAKELLIRRAARIFSDQIPLTEIKMAAILEGEQRFKQVPIDI